MKRPSSTTAPPAAFVPGKDERLRQWACKIASDLPSQRDDALQCLEHASELVRSWVHGAGLKPDRRRSAR
ncbi:hypothetical protein [Reyranella sp.]|jgi:hypothetical protein|uniref:hypothetical protein n=1 Tax=Reyranella sp. TaxID=1929291 RepID=UPI000BC90872|nr:hypothetical protein [Reyranella sp.]OYY38703.1 MAG: hypothetical protein B7Y57_20535 [Rhodospirillales bacterium 35-66-84]OYZ92268.1 MAG: hypothetical protein B7Y08_22935 [Rhodospirillales bacterium 24-66-33]OZB23672.1 MAG: hypothetical protein B7X63_19195 [Rhodospirillales bacterium 39-66-50]HQS15460.1 hypothetical protein [Reyranella sp.]HQT11986.1 hypothetical protein [Reyranella sp.]